MALGPITSWRYIEKKWKGWHILFSWSPNSLWTVTAVMKLRCLLLARNAWTNVDSMSKSRNITLVTKVCIIKDIVFPVVMYDCDSRIINKAEPWRIDAFKSWCWRRLLRVVWTARRSNQSILKEISPAYSLEGLMLWPPVVKSQHTEKDPDAGKDWGQKKKVTEGEMVGWHHQLSGHAGVHETGWCPCVLQSMKSERVRDELVSDWATTMILLCGCQLIAL